jgi:hypothetical protein
MKKLFSKTFTIFRKNGEWGALVIVKRSILRHLKVLQSLILIAVQYDPKTHFAVAST